MSLFEDCLFLALNFCDIIGFVSIEEIHLLLEGFHLSFIDSYLLFLVFDFSLSDSYDLVIVQSLSIVDLDSFFDVLFFYGALDNLIYLAHLVS